MKKTGEQRLKKENGEQRKEKKDWVVEVEKRQKRAKKKDWVAGLKIDKREQRLGSRGREKRIEKKD